MHNPRIPNLEPAPPLEGDEARFDVRAIWRVVVSRKWIILGLTALVTLIGTLMVYRQVPIYRSTSTLLIERSPVQFSPIQDPFVRYSENFLYYQTQYGLIKRRAIGQRVVDQLGLAPDMSELDAAPPSRGPIKSLLPEAWFTAPPPPTYEELLEARIAGVVASIEIESIKDSQLVNIHVDHSDPAMAAKIANAVGEAFIEDNIEGRLNMSTQMASYLTERLSSLRDKLTEAERALQAFRDREELVDSNESEAMVGRELTVASDKLSRARGERERIEALLTQIRALDERSSLELASIPEVLEFRQVQGAMNDLNAAQRSVDELSRRYGPRHPTMIAAQDELASSVDALDRQVAVAVRAVENDYEIARSNEQAAESDLQRARTQARDLDRKEFELARLERDVETNRQIFEKFQTQFKESDASGDMRTANARLVERARPSRAPIRPNHRRWAIFSMLAGLALSIGLAFLMDYLDNAVKGIEDVEQKLAIPVIGTLPLLKGVSGDKLAPMREFKESRRSAFAEAIRTIRTGLLLSSMDEERQVILVTSSVPGEGKTTLSMNLAHALGELKRVILIDADMRRPTVAKAMDSGSRPIGLSHYVSGEVDIDECIRPLRDGVDVISAGTVPPNPLELLSSLRFSSAIEKLTERYDQVVIDCAPALAVSDAMVLSRLATAVVYVVRADSTPIHAASAGLKRLRRSGARIVGAVLNRVERKGQRYYGRYSGYYGGAYYTDYGYVQETANTKG